MTFYNPTPDAAYLRECFDYSPDVGVLTWLERPAGHFASDAAGQDFNRRWAGRPAGSVARQKYGSPRLLVKLNCKTFQYARLVWALQTGETVFGAIDHIDGDATNNRWNNLREVTTIQNGQNRTHKSKSEGGVVGVNLCRRTGKWRAGVTLNKKFVWLGHYEKHSDAVDRVMSFKREHFGEFARHA